MNSSQKEIEVITQYVPDEDLNKWLALSRVDDTVPGLALVNSAYFGHFPNMKLFVILTDEIQEMNDHLPQVKEVCTVEWPYTSKVIAKTIEELIGETDESKTLSCASKWIAEIKKGDL